MMTYWIRLEWHCHSTGWAINTMTVYGDKNRRGRVPADTPIVAGTEWTQDPRREYVCSYCNRTMTKLQDRNSANISYFCSACNVETNAEEIDNLRTRSRLQMPEGPVNTTPYAAFPPEPELKRKKVTIKGGLAELQKRGIKIKNYTESRG
jgi:DNA-directed RNA polymerase subunit RPC12/RpoP